MRLIILFYVFYCFFCFFVFLFFVFFFVLYRFVGDVDVVVVMFICLRVVVALLLAALARGWQSLLRERNACERGCQLPIPSEWGMLAV